MVLMVGDAVALLIVATWLMLQALHAQNRALKLSILRNVGMQNSCWPDASGL